MRTRLLLIFLLAAGAARAGDPGRLESIRRHSLGAAISVEKTIPLLAEYLAEGCRDDEEKSWAVYCWVTDRIAYDGPAFLSGHIDYKGPEAVLKTRLSVCSGYADLYAALGRKMGLRVEVAEGWAKGYGYVPGQPMGRANHAWNVVRSGQRSWLVDSTWGAGSLSDAGKFERQFDDFWFRTRPDQFFYSHFPEKSLWQLLTPERSRSAFEALPWYEPAFFRWGMRLHDGPSKLPLDGWQVSFDLPVNIKLLAHLEKDGRELPGCTLVERPEPGRATVTAHPPGPGSYQLQVFASYQQARMSDGAARYCLKSATGGAPPFPLTYRTGLRLLTPREGRLKAGDTLFRLAVPGARQVSVAGQNLSRSGDLFSGTVRLSPGQLTVYATLADGKGWSVLEYQVR